MQNLRFGTPLNLNILLTDNNEMSHCWDNYNVMSMPTPITRLVRVNTFVVIVCASVLL